MVKCIHFGYSEPTKIPLLFFYVSFFKMYSDFSPSFRVSSSLFSKLIAHTADRSWRSYNRSCESFEFPFSIWHGPMVLCKYILGQRSYAARLSKPDYSVESILWCVDNIWAIWGSWLYFPSNGRVHLNVLSWPKKHWATLSLGSTLYSQRQAHYLWATKTSSMPGGIIL